MDFALNAARNGPDAAWRLGDAREGGFSGGYRCSCVFLAVGRSQRLELDNRLGAVVAKRRTGQDRACVDCQRKTAFHFDRRSVKDAGKLVQYARVVTDVQRVVSKIVKGR